MLENILKKLPEIESLIMYHSLKNTESKNIKELISSKIKTVITVLNTDIDTGVQKTKENFIESIESLLSLKDDSYSSLLSEFKNIIKENKELNNDINNIENNLLFLNKLFSIYIIKNVLNNKKQSPEETVNFINSRILKIFVHLKNKNNILNKIDEKIIFSFLLNENAFVTYNIFSFLTENKEISFEQILKINEINKKIKTALYDFINSLLEKETDIFDANKRMQRLANLSDYTSEDANLKKILLKNDINYFFANALLTEKNRENIQTFREFIFTLKHLNKNLYTNSFLEERNLKNKLYKNFLWYSSAHIYDSLFAKYLEKYFF